ncbi:MAG: Sec-independent protein translocase protein TatB [Porticoccaceae bacterium]|nr:Sec-independent protein translocase protein TatB [Porticoccaceae bacterium]|tara:strand:+ start:91 stop:477 length:387 start_codon:yes stop_codon:yes gene_type:complete
MFDIGFSEIMVVAVISLIIMGPERLPETVRTLSLWLGRVRQFVSSAREEIEDEVGIDEIRRQLRNEKIMRDLEKSKNELSVLAKDVTDISRTDVKNEQIMRDLEKSKNELSVVAKDVTDVNRIESKND